MKKHYMLNLEENLIEAIKLAAELKGMSVSGFITWITTDKIAYFMRNKESYFYAPDENKKREYEKYQKDISKLAYLCKEVYKVK